MRAAEMLGFRLRPPTHAKTATKIAKLAGLLSGSWQRHRDGRSSGCSVPRRGKNSQRWRGIAIHGKSRLTDGPDRQEHSRRSAGSLPKSESSDPPCFTLRTESAPASGPSLGLVEP